MYMIITAIVLENTRNRVYLWGGGGGGQEMHITFWWGKILESGNMVR